MASEYDSLAVPPPHPNPIPDGEREHRAPLIAVETLSRRYRMGPQTVHALDDVTVSEVLREATLKAPTSAYVHKGGRRGVHTEHLGYILADMQFLQRAYPGATW